MIERVALDDIYNIVYEDNIAFESRIINDAEGFKINCAEAIRDDIGIQVAMADILLTGKLIENSDEIISFVFPVGKDHEALKKLQCVFETTHKVSIKEKTIGYEVYAPREEAIQEFNQLLEHNELNRWIKHFYPPDNADDCDKVGLYKFRGKICNRKEIESMMKDDFFKYHLCCNEGQLTQPGFNISRYALSDIDSVPYINEIYSIVKDLYVIVSEAKRPNGESCYEKRLTWKYNKLPRGKPSGVHRTPASRKQRGIPHPNIINQSEAGRIRF